RCLLNNSTVEVVGIITKEKSIFNADFCSLKEIAENNNISCFIEEKHSEIEMVQWSRNLSADVIYCFGWSQLLKEEMLNLSRLGIIGYHPAELPKNRGRHPIIWSLTLGLERTASTFFFMNEGADSGDIISQEVVKIDSADDAASLYEKLIRVAIIQIQDFTAKLVDNTYTRIKQDHSRATYWRKRTKRDGVIDWRMPARGIYNLIRALTYPYVGAHFEYKNQEIKVWKAQVVSEKAQFEDLEPGRIIIVDSKTIDVQCGMGVVRLLNYDWNGKFVKGECLL
ncbi:MAG: formyltransferase family protein, partial [Enterococcus thailandicus]|nr:formyltransferase family protein [Enterococcus thailandicus]